VREDFEPGEEDGWVAGGADLFREVIAVVACFLLSLSLSLSPFLSLSLSVSLSLSISLSMGYLCIEVVPSRLPCDFCMLVILR